MAEVIARFSMTDDGVDTSLEVPGETNMRDLMEGLAQLTALYLKQFDYGAVRSGRFVDPDWFFCLFEARIRKLFADGPHKRVFSERDEFEGFFKKMDKGWKR